MSDNDVPLFRSPTKSDFANVHASEGSGTTVLTRADSLWHVFNLIAARSCQLPSAGISAGDVVVLENRGAFDLTVLSSDGTALTYANVAAGSLGDPTIRVGKVILIATQAVPTASTHWKVSEVYEEGVQAMGNSSGAIVFAISMTFRRYNRLVVAGMSANGTFSSAVSSFSASWPAAINRLINNSPHIYPVLIMQTGSTLEIALCEFGSGAGQMQFKRPAGATWPGSGTGLIGQGSTAAEAVFSYYI